MHRLTLSQRIFLVTTVALLPAAVIIVLNQVTLRQGRQADLHAEAARMAELAGLEMDRIINGVEAVIRTAGEAPMVIDRSRQECSDYLARVVRNLPTVYAIVVINLDGTERCLSYPEISGKMGSNKEIVANARRASGRYIGEYTEIGDVNRKILPIAVSNNGQTGTPSAVIAAALDLEWLSRHIKDRNYAKNGAMTIADRKGRILARYPEAKRFVGTVIPDEYQYLVTAQKPGTQELTSQDGTQRIIGYRPVGSIPEGLYVSAGFSTEDAYASINRATLWNGLIAATGIAAAYFMAYLTSDIFIRRPFQKLVDTVESWRRDHVFVRTGLDANLGEFGRAGRVLDAFMDELVANRAERLRTEQQREMLQKELSHRIKNILSTVQVIARQTFRKVGQPGEVASFTKRLAVLGMAHQLLMQDNWQSAPITSVVSTCLAPFDDPKNPRFTINGPAFAVQSKATVSLSMALHELCTNAVKYGALSVEGGTVSVMWTIAGIGEDAGFVLTWRETGGPTVAPPSRKGFGSAMIKDVLSSQINGQVEMIYDAGGLICTISTAVREIVFDGDIPELPNVA